MYTDLISSPFSYRPPWDSQPLSQRLDALRRGRPRIAWLYERPDTSTFRYRCLNPTETIAHARPDIGAAWFELADVPELTAELPRIDVLVICRVRYSAQVARLVVNAKAAGVRLVFDCDDLVFDTRHVHLLLDTLDQDTEPEAAWETWFALIGRLEATCRLCSAGTTTNPYLAQRLVRSLGGDKVGIIPNYFNRIQEECSRQLLEAKRKRRYRGNRRVTIGYFSGTPTHNRDFAVAAPALARILGKDPRVDVRVVGFLDRDGPLRAFADRVQLLPLTDYLNLQKAIAEVEINIAPLQDNEFTNCKSELKFFEACAVGTWSVATPTYTYQNAIQDGVNGRLARAHEWDGALLEAIELVREPSRYGDIADAAAAKVYERYGWNKQTTAILDALGLA